MTSFQVMPKTLVWGLYFRTSAPGAAPGTGALILPLDHVGNAEGAGCPRPSLGVSNPERRQVLLPAQPCLNTSPALCWPLSLVCLLIFSFFWAPEGDLRSECRAGLREAGSLPRTFSCALRRRVCIHPAEPGGLELRAGAGRARNELREPATS